MNDEVKEFLRQNGRKGGQATKEKYGSEHYRKIAKERWDKKLSTEETIE